MSERADRPYDVVVFGATSFVGQILCKYLVDRIGVEGSVSWAIAGRSSSKLAEVANDTGATVPRIVADAADLTAMSSLVESTRVVISTVGPYAKYGSVLVEAAAKAGTDYCDLTGEPQWMSKMIDAYQTEAEESGARIVHSCGFDSIPSDLGVWFTQKQALTKFEEPCTQIEMRVKTLKGGASGGTIASGLNVVAEAAADPSLRKVLANPYALAPAEHRFGVDQPNVTLPKRDAASGGWVAPFVMASVNTKIVHRTNALLGHRWGREFRYDEAMMTGSGPLGAIKSGGMVGGLGAGMALVAIGPVRRLLEKRVLPKPGEGPSPEAQQAGSFDLRFYGTTGAGQRVTTKVTGDADPGYGSTAKMLGEAALCLLGTDRSDVAGGFWTPASALGDELLEQLKEHAGLTFEVV